MDDNPIIKALPPETDYLTYLTIVEYNLTRVRLPSLHTVLQNPDLTINIGWDLVHILLPLLPESQECLEDVAKLGNPREVILKVTELLEEIGRDDLDDNNDSDEDLEELEEGADAKETGQTTAPSHSLPSSSFNALKFQHLVSMLTALHPRIKTKFPSRFLATSLQAILPAYVKTSQTSTCTATLLTFIRTVAVSTRPRLPARAGSAVSVEPEPAPDPEASAEPSGTEEAALQMRLLQSFLTFAVETWVEGLEAVRDFHGLAWAARFWERSHADRVPEGRMSVRKAFVEPGPLKERDSIIQEIATTAQELKISLREILLVVTRPEIAPKGDLDDLPSSPSEISLSHTGCLYVLTALLFQATTPPDTLSLPNYLRILDQFKPSLGLIQNPSPGILPIVDAVLFLGLLVFLNPPTSPTPDLTRSEQVDDNLLNHIQALSEICATNPSQSLRTQAHNLISEALTKHSSPSLRKNFLVPTLRDTPYVSLKASAVIWLKEGLLAAAASSDTNTKVLSREKALLAQAFPYLYPEPAYLLKAPSGTIVNDVAFLLTGFNLYYLLYSNAKLREMFEIEVLNEKWSFVGTRLNPWGTLLAGARKAIDEEEGGDGATRVGWESTQLMLLEDIIGRVRAALEGSKGGEGIKVEI